LSIVEDALGDESVFEAGRLDPPLLLLGLMFREVARAMEVEPGEPSQYPQQLVDSPFGIKEMQRIEEFLNEVDLPSDQ
jgi:hypothetical protein